MNEQDLLETPISEETDLLDSNINENTQEFITANFGLNPATTGEGLAKATAIPVPGGSKEEPSAKPYDKAAVPVPGGSNERPTGQPWDKAAISIPAGTKIPLSAYNTALDRLQKSYKEVTGKYMEDVNTLVESTIGMLMNCIPVEETVDMLQDQYTEDAIEEAIWESYCNGPLYEKVDRSDKAEIKEIVNKLKKSIKQSSFKFNIKHAKGYKSMNRNRDVIKYAWQTFGAVRLEADQTISDAKKYFTEIFKDVIGDYVINAIHVKYDTGVAVHVGYGVTVGRAKEVEYYLLYLDSDVEKIKVFTIKGEPDMPADTDEMSRTETAKGDKKEEKKDKKD